MSVLTLGVTYEGGAPVSSVDEAIERVLIESPSVVLVAATYADAFLAEWASPDLSVDELTTSVVIVGAEADGDALRARGATDVVGSSPDVVAVAARAAARQAELRQQMAAAAKETDGLIDAVVHELKGRVGAIQGWASVVGEGLDAEAAKELQHVIAAAEEIDDLGLALVAFAAANHPTKIKPTISVDGALDLVQEELTDAASRTERRGTGDYGGDRDVLVPVLREQLAHAIEFGPSGKIVVTAADHSITLADDGPGVPPRFLDGIFSPLRRLHGRAAHRGHGLGLATVRRRITRAGGRVWAEAGSPGLTVRISLSLTRL